MKKNGYIAITSAVIISIVLMAVVFTASAVGFRSRANIFDSSSKLSSHYLAEACFESARLKLSQNPLYAGNETLAIDGNECNILPIEIVIEVPPSRIIRTNSTLQRATTSLKVKINFLDLSIISWEEEVL